MMIGTSGINRKLKKFAKLVTLNPTLQEKMRACPTYEDAYAIASSIIQGFTFEEFKELGEAIRSLGTTGSLPSVDLFQQEQDQEQE